VNPTLVAGVVFACCLGGARIAMALQRFLSAEHLSADIKEAVKLGKGVVATMTALVLGLGTASAKTAFGMQQNLVRRSASQVSRARPRAGAVRSTRRGDRHASRAHGGVPSRAGLARRRERAGAHRRARDVPLVPGSTTASAS
jgi:hypothetical protein